MTGSDAAFASFQRKWLEANPEQAVVAVFQALEERTRAAAYGSLVHELEGAAFGVREAQIGAAKLAWWRQELIVAATGNARHPVTRQLFADARARQIDAALWAALAEGALVQLDALVAADFTQAVAALKPLYAPIAEVEAALHGRDAAGDETNANLWIYSQLLQTLSRASAERARLPLPMNLVARHGVSTADTDDARARRTAALRDYLKLLSGNIQAALTKRSPLPLGRRVRARLDLALALRAQRHRDPAATLARSRGPSRWRALWIAWREARRD